jgi:hypothetical protein
MFLRKFASKYIATSPTLSSSRRLMRLLNNTLALPSSMSAHGIFKRDIKIVTRHITRESASTKCLTPMQQQERIYSIYRKLRHEITGVVERARSANKKILITVGEDHGDKRSLIIQLLIVNLILEKNLLKNLMVEAPQDFLDELRNKMNAIDQKYLNLRHLLQVADKAEIKVTKS